MVIASTFSPNSFELRSLSHRVGTMLYGSWVIERECNHTIPYFGMADVPLERFHFPVHYNFELPPHRSLERESLVIDARWLQWKHEDTGQNLHQHERIFPKSQAIFVRWRIYHGTSDEKANEAYACNRSNLFNEECNFKAMTND